MIPTLADGGSHYQSTCAALMTVFPIAAIVAAK